MKNIYQNQNNFMALIHKFGEFGENLAKNYLIKKGYKILSTRYKTKHGEIDIIAEYKNYLVFCEVKTRTNTNFGYPEESVNKEKLKKIAKTGYFYINEKNINKHFQIDVIGIQINKLKKKAKLNHYKNVYL